MDKCNYDGGGQYCNLFGTPVSKHYCEQACDHKNDKPKISTKVEGDTLLTTLYKEIEVGLNKKVDEIIEKQVEEFRKELVYNKNIAIAELLSSIEISAQRDTMVDNINFNICIRPRKAV